MWYRGSVDWALDIWMGHCQNLSLLLLRYVNAISVWTEGNWVWSVEVHQKALLYKVIFQFIQCSFTLMKSPVLKKFNDFLHALSGELSMNTFWSMIIQVKKWRNNLNQFDTSGGSSIFHGQSLHFCICLICLSYKQNYAVRLKPDQKQYIIVKMDQSNPYLVVRKERG